MRPMPELKVVEVPIGDLYEYENNAKIHDRENVDSIANSIAEFGYVNPVLAWHDGNGDSIIVGGHGRVMAAKKQGLEKIPVIYVDHLDDQQRRELTHVLNQTTLQTGFDFAILEREFESMPDFDWESFGFSADSFENVEFEELDQAPKSKVVSFDDTLGVFVECSDEDDQERVYTELIESGFTCRLLTL